MEVRPLTATLGAEVHGVDLATELSDDATKSAINSPEAVEGPIIPHRYVFLDVSAGDVDSVQRVVPLLRQRAHEVADAARARRTRKHAVDGDAGAGGVEHRQRVEIPVVLVDERQDEAVRVVPEGGMGRSAMGDATGPTGRRAPWRWDFPGRPAPADRDRAGHW